MAPSSWINSRVKLCSFFMKHRPPNHVLGTAPTFPLGNNPLLIACGLSGMCSEGSLIPQPKSGAQKQLRLYTLSCTCLPQSVSWSEGWGPEFPQDQLLSSRQLFLHKIASTECILTLFLLLLTEEVHLAKTKEKKKSKSKWWRSRSRNLTTFFLISSLFY